jgi:membrane protein DedA with SNARE-associated domain
MATMTESAAIGTVFGCLVGFAVGRYGGARRSE